MIKRWFVRGDCHGNFDWVDSFLPDMELTRKETAIIILGDAGLNYYLNKTDRNKKCKLQNSGFTFYLLRGNHEQRPELLPNITEQWDNETNQYIYIEPEFPNIRYLIDGYIYKFGIYSALCIGGAYSVDKFYRLKRAYCFEDMDDNYLAEHAGWFRHEQLSLSEMDAISNNLKNVQYIDFVMTHTCPYKWMPTDLFLPIDQSKVDNTMEKWLDTIEEDITYYVWLFGHFHADRLERPNVEQFFNDIESLDDIYKRWEDPDEANVWWLVKGPQYKKSI